MQPLFANLTLLLQLLAQSDRSKYDELSKSDNQIARNVHLLQSADFSQQDDHGCRYDVYEDDRCKPVTTNFELTEIKNLLTTSAKSRPKRNGLRCPKWLWPNGRVPYENRLINKSIEGNFLAAVDELNSLNCVRFEPRSWATTSPSGKFLLVEETRPVLGKSCAATAGTTAAQPKVYLSSVCTKGKIMHELMHTLGFAHEHQRPDRDDYVKIDCDNIIDNVTQDFRKLKSGVVDTFDQPYDFLSIMHYRIDHFSKSDKPTIIPLKSAVKNIDVAEIGSMKRLSESDVVKIRRMYCPDQL